MYDIPRQTAAGKVLLHFAMSLDGYVATADHGHEWMRGETRPDMSEEYVATTGAILGGRKGWDAYPDANAPYGGWTGAMFILTHHPEKYEPVEGVTFLNCDVAEAVRLALEAAGGKNLEVFSPTIGRQLLERGLIDEIVLHIMPVLLGHGIRVFDNPGGAPIPLTKLDGEPLRSVDVRYRPA